MQNDAAATVEAVLVGNTADLSLQHSSKLLVESEPG
jgi:hypothetical protein